VPSGHPDLVNAIVEEIQTVGPISFARFMDLALYHPQFGYYMRFGDKADAEQGKGRIGEDRLGWAGDFYTSSDVHPVLARALAGQIDQMDDLLGRPDPLTMIEMGAGKGVFARDFLAACANMRSRLFDRLRYVIIERSPAMQAAQQDSLSEWLIKPGRVAWLNGLADLGIESVEGVLFSNELVDAFPVHRIKVEQGEPREVFVAYEGGRFCERLRPLSMPELGDYLGSLAAMGIPLQEGAHAEINLRAIEWIKDVARIIRCGFVVTIDYGHTAQDLYGPDRQCGTLLCYYHHMASDNPYERVGLQDMTAHVDFTGVAAAGEAAGLQVTGFTNQMSFLMGLGVEQMLESLEPGSREFQSVIQLLRPEGMGRTFKILVQHKGIDAPGLDGLRYKPFFGSALAGTAR
jgi:SAM-dependent MidA family methyltransferase